jgi:hypothetical protein
MAAPSVVCCLADSGITGGVAPGSTFGPVVATAGLGDAVLDGTELVVTVERFGCGSPDAHADSKLTTIAVIRTLFISTLQIMPNSDSAHTSATSTCG